MGYRAAASDLMAQLSRAFRLAVPGIDLLPTCLTVAEIDGAVQGAAISTSGCPPLVTTSMDESQVFDVRILSRRTLAPWSRRWTIGLQSWASPHLADPHGEVIVMAERGTHPELLDRFAEFFHVHDVHPILREYPAKSPAELIVLVASGLGVMICLDGAFSEPAERAR